MVKLIRRQILNMGVELIRRQAMLKHQKDRVVIKMQEDLLAGDNKFAGDNKDARTPHRARANSQEDLIAGDNKFRSRH